MTINTEACSIQYTGTGLQTAFAFPFLIPANSDGTPAGVVAIVDSAGNTSIANPSNYSFSGVGNPSGGVVVFPLVGAPIDSQTKLVILRDLAYDQLTAVSNQAFYPHTVEQMGDYMTMLIQQLNEMAGRAIHAPPGEVFTTYLPGASQRAGLFLSFDGAGNPIAVAGTGGGGGTAWAAITGKPDIIASIQGLTPSAGMIVEYTSPTSAHLIPTPSGGGGGVNSVNTRTGAVVLTIADVDAQPAFGNAVRTTLLAGANITISAPVAGVSTISASGGGGGGNMQPTLLSDFGPIDGGGVLTTDNDAAIAAAEAAGDSAIYLPDGIYATTRAENAFTKHYVGRGQFLFPGSANDKLPAKYTYLAAKAPGAGLTGRTGWFFGSKFTEQEYKVIGPGVREFDINAIYYDATTIPRNSWMDINSGNSGSQAFLTAGAAAGSSVIALPAAADASWVGKTVAFNNSYGGAAVETKTVTAVNTAGNNITVNSPLANTYTWNPAGGFAPGIYFAPRTWGGEKYLKMTCLGGGDYYGNNIRTIINYTPKATEKHVFQAGTYSQYGGDVNALTSGVMMQCWESQLQAQGHDVGAIAFVQSFVRDDDKKLDGGRFWAGTWFQSTGSRPADVCHTVVGFWRNGMDLANATLEETTTITVAANAGDNSVTVASKNGFHLGDTLQIGAEVFTPNTLAFYPQIILGGALLVGSYPIGTPVTYIKGGAALNMKLGQRQVWNSSVSQSARGGDPLQVFSPFYGNVQGDLIEESGNDGSSDYWSVRFARGFSNTTPDTARIRLRPTGVNIFGTGAHTVNGTSLGLTSTTSFNLDLSTGGALMSFGPGILARVSGTHLQLSNDGGATWPVNLI